MQLEMSMYRRMLKVCRRHYSRTQSLVKTYHLYVSALIHHVWLARNSSMFEGIRIDVEQILR